MLKKWFVTLYCINQSDGNSEKTERLDDEKSATLKFHSMCASYGSNAQTKFCCVKLINPDGFEVRSETFDNSVETE